MIHTLPHWRQMTAILLKRFEQVMGYLDTNPYYHSVSGNVIYAHILPNPQLMANTTLFLKYARMHYILFRRRYMVVVIKG